MGKIKSARGEVVDFDLLRIKESIANAPKTTNVRAREDFIDQKFKRRLKRMTNDVVETVSQQAAGNVNTTPSALDKVEPSADVEDIVEDVIVDEPPKPSTQTNQPKNKNKSKE